MSVGSTWARLARLTPKQVVLLAEASVEVARAVVVRKRHSMLRAGARLGQQCDEIPDTRTLPVATEARARRLGRAVRQVTNRLPEDGTCWIEALAVTAMLRRRHIPSITIVGVRRALPDDDVDLVTHAWVRVGDTIVTGSQARRGHRRMLAFAQPDAATHGASAGDGRAR